MQLFYDVIYAKALKGAYQQWKNNVFPSHLLSDIRSPAGFDAAGSMVRSGDVVQALRVSDSVDQHIEWLQEDVQAGATQLYLHNVNLKQQNFIDMFGQKVIPILIP